MGSPVCVTGGPVVVEGLVGATPVEVNGVLSQLLAARGQLDAEIAAVVAYGTQIGAPGSDGHSTVSAWVSAVGRMERTTALVWDRRARLLADHPGYADALAAGTLSTDHLDLLADADANERVRVHMDGFVDLFVRIAAELPLREFRLAVTHWVTLADEDGSHRDSDAAHDRRHLSVRRHRDGSATLRGWLPMEQAAVFTGVFDRFVDTERQVERDRIRSQLDTGKPVDTPRSAGQVGADALCALAVQSASTPAGSRRPEPLVNLVVDLATATDLLGAGTTTLSGLASPDDLRSRICRTADGHPVDPRQMFSALLTGRVRTLIVDAGRTPVAIGAPRSLFSKKIRDAVAALNIGCTWLGCTAAHRHLQGDHAHPRNKGGPTDPRYCNPECGHHNRWRHVHGYHVTKNPNGTWTVTRPDGTTL